MAKDVITRFKLETTGFDSKIKEAAKELSAYSKTATQAKEGFNQFTKANVDAAKALGTMATSTTNAKDRAKELVGAFNDAAKAYNALSDEQKQSDWAKALSGSLTQLQQRIKETKAEMQGLNNSMGDMGGGGIFSGLGSKMEGALAVFGGNLMTKAAGAVANLGAEMADMVKQGIEMAKAGEGVRIAFERLGNGQILDGLREATHGTVTDIELMKAAVKFNDFKLPLEELGTMLAFAQQKAKDTGQSVDYMVDSIVTGLGRKSLMILDNLGLSATEIRERMKETGDMTKAVGSIIRDQMKNAGDYVETAADRAAQANVSLQNKMEELGRKFAPIEEASNQLWTSMKIGILDVVGGPLARLLNGLTEAGRLMNQQMDVDAAKTRLGGSDGNKRVDRMIAQLGDGKGSGAYQTYKNQLASFDKYINQKRFSISALSGDNSSIGKQNRQRLQNELDAALQMRAEYVKKAQELHKKATADIVDSNKGELQSVASLKKELKDLEEQRKKAVKSGDQELVETLTKQISQTKTNLGYLDPNAVKTTSTTKKDLDELQKIQEQIAALTKEAYTADEGRQKEIHQQIGGLQEQEKKLIAIRDLVTGKSDSKELTIVNNYDSGSVSSGQAFIDQLKADLAQSNIDADMARLSQLMTDGLRAGLESQDLTGISTELKRRIMEGGDVPDDVWQELEEYIQENLDDANFTFSIDFNSKQIEEAAKKQKKDAMEMAQDWRAAGSAISAVGSAMQQIEDPATKVLGTIAQAVATMALSYAQAAASPAVTSTGWGWIAFAATGVATMLSSIAAIKNATSGFANGGIVPGNSFSGDNLRTADYGINAGELVLNKAQQGNLASQLEGGELGDLQLDTRVSAEDIIFILNNNANRRGYRPFIND